jgi:hypothetical protein
MPRLIDFNRLLLIGLAALVAAWPVAQVAHAGPSEPAVPPEIQVGDGFKVFLIGHAVGVQIYSCNAIPGGYRWELVAPRANLYDDRGKLIITHYGGPTWQANDGSKAFCRVVDRVTVDATAIQWLKLSTTTAPGAQGDRLVATKYIQRIATTGGLAPPPAGCSATTTGAREEIPYTADYYFWK